VPHVRAHSETRNIVLLTLGLLLQPGCQWLIRSSFPAGVYVGDIPCGIDVVTADGEPGHDDFTSPITLEIAADGAIFINGDEIVVGARTTRSLPNADLEFEVTDVDRQSDSITITYAPRPSLPGITADGELVEEYIWHAGQVLASANADLTITDVDGPNQFTIECDGTLAPE